MAVALSRKTKYKNALEEVQSKLLLGVTVWQTFGPVSGHPKRLRDACLVAKRVSARTKTGVEFIDPNGRVGELAWPDAHFVKFWDGFDESGNPRGFMIHDKDGHALVSYSFQEPEGSYAELLAAQ